MQSDGEIGIQAEDAADVAIGYIGAERGSVLGRDDHGFADRDDKAVHRVEGHAGAIELEGRTDVVTRDVMAKDVTVLGADDEGVTHGDDAAFLQRAETGE